MPRQCSACSHQERRGIEEALIRNEPLLEIVARFGGLSESGLKRHKHNCISRVLERAKAQAPVRERIDLLATAERVMQDLGRIGLQAEEEGNLSVAVHARIPFLRAMEFAAKVQEGSTQSDYTRDPRFLASLGRLTKILERFPEAYRAVTAEWHLQGPPAPGGDSEKG